MAIILGSIAFSHSIPVLIGVVSFQSGFYGGRESNPYVRQAWE